MEELGKLTYETISFAFNSNDVTHHTSSGKKEIDLGKKPEISDMLAYIENFESESGKKLMNTLAMGRGILFILE